MPTVDENRLKGNFGEAFVAARLSSECLVRPVANGTDIGVDLYCETVEEETPFLHFWMQVKAGSAQCQVSEDGLSASFSFNLNDLKYWYQQPVPVFAALVPVDWPVAEDPDIYIVDLTSKLLEGIPGGRDSITLKSNFMWRAGYRDDVLLFLKFVVPFEVARWQIRNGVVAPIPTIRPSYVQQLPIVPVSRYIEPILKQIRSTATSSIYSLYQRRQINDNTAPFRRLMASIVEQFGNDPHYENFFYRAISYHADRNFPRAIEYYDKAIQCIQDDPDVRETGPFLVKIVEIKQLKERANQQEDIPFPPPPNP